VTTSPPHFLFPFILQGVLLLTSPPPDMFRSPYSLFQDPAPLSMHVTTFVCLRGPIFPFFLSSPYPFSFAVLMPSRIPAPLRCRPPKNPLLVFPQPGDLFFPLLFSRVTQLQFPKFCEGNSPILRLVGFISFVFFGEDSFPQSPLQFRFPFPNCTFFPFVLRLSQLQSALLLRDFLKRMFFILLFFYARAFSGSELSASFTCWMDPPCLQTCK